MNAFLCICNCFPGYFIFFFSIRFSLIVENESWIGPKWDNEPPGLIEFINTRGAEIPCSAKGYPTPSVNWISMDRTPVTNITGLRTVLFNGTLIFSSFQPEQYRPDIQTATYRCLATNAVGTLASVDVQVRAGINIIVTSLPL